MPAKHRPAVGNNRVRAKRQWSMRMKAKCPTTLRKRHKTINRIRRRGPVMLIQRYVYPYPSVKMKANCLIHGFSCYCSRQFNKIQKQTTITTKVQIKKICPAPIVAHSPQPFGVVMYAVKWYATHAVSTSNCTVSIGHIRCDATQFTHAEDDQRVINPDEEVCSILVQSDSN